MGNLKHCSRGISANFGSVAYKIGVLPHHTLFKFPFRLTQPNINPHMYKLLLHIPRFLWASPSKMDDLNNAIEEVHRTETSLPQESKYNRSYPLTDFPRFGELPKELRL
jgi:hypothetical protein